VTVSRAFGSGSLRRPLSGLRSAGQWALPIGSSGKCQCTIRIARHSRLPRFQTCHPAALAPFLSQRIVVNGSAYTGQVASSMNEPTRRCSVFRLILLLATPLLLIGVGKRGRILAEVSRASLQSMTSRRPLNDQHREPGDR